MDSENSVGKFISWDSYYEFARRVKQERRYIWDEYVTNFIEAVRSTRHSRDSTISKGEIYWRAQRGHDTRTRKNGQVQHMPFREQRMKPNPNFTQDGRTNSAGIPVLYLANTKETAISEVRPWVGTEISVAKFEIIRNLNSIDLSRKHGNLPWQGNLTFHEMVGWEKPEPAVEEEMVWETIDNAFSEPVSLPEEVTDYVPTQILAELFRDLNYDAIQYRSQFGDPGRNVAVFDANAAKFIDCELYRVSEISVRFSSKYPEQRN